MLLEEFDVDKYERTLKREGKVPETIVSGVWNIKEKKPS